MSIGNNIKNLRKKAGLTQEEFSSLIGISRSYLGDLENDRRNPSIETIKKISKLLNVSIIYLLTESPTFTDIEFSQGQNDLEIFENSKLNTALEKIYSLDLEKTPRDTFIAIGNTIVLLDYIESRSDLLGSKTFKTILEVLEWASLSAYDIGKIENSNVESISDFEDYFKSAMYELNMVDEYISKTSTNLVNLKDEMWEFREKFLTEE